MRVGFRNIIAAFGVAALGLLAMPKPAQAALIIEFDDTQVFGGTITQVGTVTTGTNVLFDFITLQDDVTNSVVAAAQCGDNTAQGDPSKVCVMNFTFDSSNPSASTITITTLTGVYDAGADLTPYTADTGGQIVAPGGVLLSGSLSGVTGGINVGAVILNGTDTKNADLLDFFSVIIAGDFSLTSTEIFTTSTGSVKDADLINSGNIQLIPEPGMLTLFGLGLLGIGRKFRQRRN
jgi:hypothetical protein